MSDNKPGQAATVAHNLPDSEGAPVPIKTFYARTIFNRLTKMQKDKGLPFPQDLIRLAVVKLLEQSGY